MEKKKEQLLLIEPQNELKFRGPFNTHVTSRMRLTNPTDKVILYKIKTTAPKKYCVRPNGGILSPQKSTEVNIVLQPFIFDPNEKNRHKFMVQSAIAPAGAEQYASVEQLWKEINPLELMDSKLRCVFEVTADSAPQTGSTVTSSGDEQQTVYSAPESASPFKSGAGGDDSAMITTSDTAKATAELRQLREEESQLRQENLMLKEQVLRLKMALDDAGANDGAKGGANVWSGNTPSYQQQIAYAPPNLPLPVYLIISLLVGILCMLFGKFVL
ncbi:vesicle-associated membrane protein-associated protein B-like [Lutzomyia longipalpis]|nr:vesicle-associated membrane protein-associated protein B-like [Lutzomyia longipalpis]